MTTRPRLALGFLLASCVVTLDARQAPAPTPSPSPSPAARVTPRPERFVDRVWVVEASAAAPVGALYVFLSDNVLVISSRGRKPTLGTWAEGADGLVLTEGGRSQAVEVLEQTAERFRLRLTTTRGAGEITFAPAVRPPAAPAVPVDPTPAGAATPAAPTATAAAAPPPGQPYQCGGDRVRIAFDGGTAYLTLPDDTTLALREARVADAPPSRRTFTDGQYRVVEDTSEAFTRVLFARPGFRPRPCTSVR